MKCYFISKEEREDSVIVMSEGCCLFEAECPENKIEEGESLVQKWEIQKNRFMECVARNDNGIDDSRSERSSIQIDFDKLVFDGEKFIGVYFDEPNDILYFADAGKKRICKIISEEFVGGWGDVTEGCSYWITEKE